MTAIDAASVTVVAAMGVEARPLRRLAPGVRVVHAGIALAALHEELPRDGVVLSVGLCGGLGADRPPGTVVVPAHVAREDGELVACDPDWSEALEQASRRLGYPTTTMPVVTTPHLVTGEDRARWASRGFVAADMETGLLRSMRDRVAAVRVVIDTPRNEISPAWAHPARAALDPRHWREGAWLAWMSPRLCARAARVVAEALRG